MHTNKMCENCAPLEQKYLSAISATEISKTKLIYNYNDCRDYYSH